MNIHRIVDWAFYTVVGLLVAVSFSAFCFYLFSLASMKPQVYACPKGTVLIRSLMSEPYCTPGIPAVEVE